MKDYEESELSQAVADFMRVAAKLLPLLVWAAGIGIVINLVLSSPFEVSCQTRESRRERLHSIVNDDEVPPIPAITPDAAKSAIEPVGPETKE